MAISIDNWSVLGHSSGHGWRCKPGQGSPILGYIRVRGYYHAMSCIFARGPTKFKLLIRVSCMHVCNTVLMQTMSTVN